MWQKLAIFITPPKR